MRNNSISAMHASPLNPFPPSFSVVQTEHFVRRDDNLSLNEKVYLECWLLPMFIQ